MKYSTVDAGAGELRPHLRIGLAILHSTKLASIVRSTMRAFASYEMILCLPRFVTVLAVNVADGGCVGSWHRLHSDCSVEQSKVFRHIFDAFLA